MTQIIIVVGSDLLLTTKRMRILNSYEKLSPMTGSEIMEGKGGRSSIEEWRVRVLNRLSEKR